VADITITEHPQATRREWTGLAVIALPCLIYSMDLTVLNLAVPQITAQLQPSASQLLWIVDIYGFMVAGFLVTMGTLGDRIGRRKLLLIGAAAFGCASVFAAFASTAGTLILARALLGIAAATLAPSTLSLIRNMFLDERQRTFAIGVWIACFSAGGIVGPLIGGALLAYFWWGSVFLINVPIMVVLLVIGPALLPEYRDPRSGKPDLLSAVLSLAAVLAVIYGIKRIAEFGAAILPLLVIAAGLAIGFAFVRRQRRLDDPLIDLRLFRAPGLSASLAINVMGLFTAFGFFLFVNQYLQLVLGLGPLEAGLWLAPSGGIFALGSLLAPRLVQWLPPRTVLAYGFAISAFGFLLMTQLGGDYEVWFLTSGFLLVCAGFSPAGAITTDIVVSAAPPERAGAASSISETSFEFGGALGIAVLGSIVAAAYRGIMTDGLPDGMTAEAARVAQSTLGAATAIAPDLPREVGEKLLAAAKSAFAHSVMLAAVICAVISLATATVSATLLRQYPARG
jgi:DHA2 family multidrug resistance protein-like MFS transporter